MSLFETNEFQFDYSEEIGGTGLGDFQNALSREVNTIDISVRVYILITTII